MKYLVPSIFIVLFACSDDSVNTIISPTGGINLANVVSGSESNYILYESHCDGDFNLTGDTLNVKVVEENDTLYLEESYTAGSVLSFTGRHAIYPKDGYVLIPERFNSQFLFFYGNDTIFLDRSSDIALVQNGCRLRHGQGDFVGDQIGSVEEFKIGNVEIFDKKAISCVPVFFDIDAYIFYENYLSAVHVISTDQSESITGFVAID